MRQTFWEVDVEQILKIQLHVFALEDIRVWHFSESGFYSVHSSYFPTRNLIAKAEQDRIGSSSSVPRKNLNWIWNLQVPNKMKVFLWRALSNALPVNKL